MVHGRSLANTHSPKRIVSLPDVRSVGVNEGPRNLFLRFRKQGRRFAWPAIQLPWGVQLCSIALSAVGARHSGPAGRNGHASFNFHSSFLNSRPNDCFREFMPDRDGRYRLGVAERDPLTGRYGQSEGIARSRREVTRRRRSCGIDGCAKRSQEDARAIIGSPRAAGAQRLRRTGGCRTSRPAQLWPGQPPSAREPEFRRWPSAGTFGRPQRAAISRRGRATTSR